MKSKISRAPAHKKYDKIKRDLHASEKFIASVNKLMSGHPEFRQPTLKIKQEIQRRLRMNRRTLREALEKKNRKHLIN